MKHKLLATIMFAAALSQVACSDDKPDPGKCAADPACRAGVLASAGPQLFPLGPASAAGAAQVPAAPGALNQPFRISSALAKAGVTDGALKAQSAKVAAAIQADDQNPLSTYYKSPTPDIPKEISEAAPITTNRAPSSSTASIQPITQVSASSDTGEAAR